MVIHNNGNVGIGSSDAPNYTLDVTGTVGATALQFGSNLGSKISLYGSLGSNYYGFGMQNSTLQIFSDSVGADIVFGYGSSAAFNEKMRMTGYGNVGIGTSTPAYPLDIQRQVNATTTDYGYLRSHPTIPDGYRSGSGTFGYGLNVGGAIRANGEIHSWSDARIKTDVVTVNATDSLDKINRLRVVNYGYVDKEAKGIGINTGFIAQEVEKIYPDVVDISNEVIPNIYSLATDVTWNENQSTLLISLPHAHGLKSGDMVRLISDSEQSKLYSVGAVESELVFTVSDFKHPAKEVFVYGKQVNDFRTVNYQGVLVNGISAIQALSKKSDAQQKVIEAQSSAIDELRREIESLKQRIR
jgi:hypothetical protein